MSQLTPDFWVDSEANNQRRSRLGVGGELPQIRMP